MRNTALIIAFCLILTIPMAVMAQQPPVYDEAKGEAVITSTLKGLGAETDVDIKLENGKYNIYCTWKSGTVTDEFEFLGMCIGASAELSKSTDKPSNKLVVVTQSGAKFEIELQYAVQAMTMDDNELAAQFLYDHLSCKGDTCPEQLK